MTAVIGVVEQYIEGEDFEAYTERSGKFLKAINVTESKRKRPLFLTHLQETQRITSYIAELKRKASTCNFGGNLKEHLRDRFVCGLHIERIQRKVLQEGDELTWDKACRLAMSMKAASTEAKLLAGGNRDAQINKVDPPRTTPRNRKRQLDGKWAKDQNARAECVAQGFSSSCRILEQKGLGLLTPHDTTSTLRSNPRVPLSSVLGRGNSAGADIGRPADTRRQTALTTCHDYTSVSRSPLSLRKGSYLALLCRRPQLVPGSTPAGRGEIPTAATTPASKDFRKIHDDIARYLCYCWVAQMSIKAPPLVVNVQVQGNELWIEVNTGASNTVTSEEVCSKLHNRPRLEASNKRLITYTCERLQLNWQEMIGRIGAARTEEARAKDSKLNDILEKRWVFFSQTLGHTSIKAHLQLKEGARPVSRKSCHVPHALYPIVEQELEIAEPVEIGNSSGWATPLVVVSKADGKVRLAADYRMELSDESKGRNNSNNNTMSTELEPIPEKTEAIQQLPALTDVPTLRSLLAAVGYYSRLLLQLSSPH
ncbi:hypothetical protein O3P69_014860 [Scylla paramamosain]|uniref:Uncharacterized protein n=1 Tax=Scylla paramamosain TaxID=85552 RepID=A0AAW0TY83_SCYPA